MSEKKRILLLIMIMGAASLIVGSITFHMLYRAAFKEEEKRLRETVQGQARLIEAVARHEALLHKDSRQSWDKAVFEQVREAHGNYEGFGETGEFTLGRLEGDQMVFLLRHRQKRLDQPQPIPFDSNLAEPMRQALLRKSGTVIGPDYRGVIVLAAYEPVAELNLGLVAKIDLSEIREPFIKAAATSLGFGIVLIITGACLFIKVTKPITRRLEEQVRQMEMAGHSLRESEDRFKKIIQNNADAIVVTFEDTIQFANPAAETLFDRPAKELLGQDIGLPVIGKESADVQILQTSGSTVAAAMRAVKIEWEGKPANLISLHDITERKKAEGSILHLNKVIRAIRNVNQLITKEKDRNRLIQGSCENMVATRGFNSAWIALVDEAGALIHCVEEGMGASFQTVKEGLRQGQFPQCMQKTLASSGVSIIEDVYNECVDCPLRSSYQDLMSISTRLEHAGKVYGVLVSNVPKAFALNKEEKSLFKEIGEDIAFALNNIDNDVERTRVADERKKLERQVFHLQKMEAIGTLAGGIAHDFNNILSPVIGFTEILLESTEKGSMTENCLQEINIAGNRAKELVKQILSFASQEGSETKPVQVAPIVKEVLSFIRSSIPSTIEIRSSIESESIIMGDPIKLHQILMNLCTNASYSMGNGGVLEVILRNIEIDNENKNVSTEFDVGDYIQLTVRDTGKGIKPEIIGSIFDPYFTTKPQGEGTGMGLAMVHGIVESYGGKITVDSEPDKGTVFSVYLPISKMRDAPLPYEKEELPTGTERILLVDDELPIAKMGTQILENLGYQVTARTSSIEALELFRSRSDGFDLVITDMTMPNMTGDELAMELILLRSDIPVILCTGYSKNITDEKAANIGIKAFAYKPVVKADLAKTVRKVLDEAKTETQQLII